MEAACTKGNRATRLSSRIDQIDSSRDTGKDSQASSNTVKTAVGSRRSDLDVVVAMVVVEVVVVGVVGVDVEVIILAFGRRRFAASIPISTNISSALSTLEVCNQERCIVGNIFKKRRRDGMFCLVRLKNN